MLLEQARVVIVGSRHPDLVATCKMMPRATMEEAPALDVFHALLTLPLVK